MTDSGKGLNSELESFRQAWLSDLKTKKSEPDKSHPSSSLTSPAASGQRRPSVSSHSRQKPTARRPSTTFRRAAPVDEDDDHYVPNRSFDEPAPVQGHKLDDSPGKGQPKELNSALDHFEEAMEKEAQGNMGDSLKLYRKAYRMDGGVDKRYREKYFPNHGQKQASAHTASSSTQAPATASSSATEPAQPPVEEPLSLADLISTFSALKIEPAGPVIPGDVPPPCPISEIPDELLIHILQDVAVDDVGDFVRLSRVCKHFAYLTATEERIWRRVCLGKEWGFPGMHYHFQRSVDWGELDEEEAAGDMTADEDGTFISPNELVDKRLSESLDLTMALVPSVYPTWQNMFRSRPRVRFNGCYISTVNYVRPGLASTSQLTWGAPIHIVTYYRYLRFFRDGTLISLLTTTEPGDVVHHLTRDMLSYHRGHQHVHLPSAVMTRALKGRWRLSSPELSAPSDVPSVSFATTVYTASRRNAASAFTTESGPAAADQEGDLFLETEGVGSQYTYRMDLSLKSGGKGNKNNKVVWKGFWSYNRLTDDWGEFGLKNDKPFFFSRVKSYGKGE